MYKYLLFVIIFQELSCTTDKGDPIIYSIKNSTNFNLDLVFFDKLGKTDTIFINKSDSKVLDKDSPPYDNGPFSDNDSITVIFSDYKMLTYKSFKSKDDCLNSVKNPFCQYSHYKCNGNNCTFEIDETEYLKAK
jgi:hypothetical protein